MVNAKEARARIKLHKLLNSADWPFFDVAKGNANGALEPNVELSQDQIKDPGDNFKLTWNVCCGSWATARIQTGAKLLSAKFTWK